MVATVHETDWVAVTKFTVDYKLTVHVHVYSMYIYIIRMHT
jgi:hypothetical protein